MSQRVRVASLILAIIVENSRVALDTVLSYELTLGKIAARIGGRRVCAVCKAVYHITACQPTKDTICDRCGGRLIQRDDDRPDVIRVRMRKYNEATKPLTEFYAERNKLISISAEG
jgi:adenylate kinase